MHRHCGTNNRVPRRTFTDPCKPEVRPGSREESASTAWLAAPATNARDTTKVYIRRLETGCGPTLYRKCHSHNPPGKRHNNTWVEPLAGNFTPAPHGKVPNQTDFQEIIAVILRHDATPQWRYSKWLAATTSPRTLGLFDVKSTFDIRNTYCRSISAEIRLYWHCILCFRKTHNV